MNLFKQLIYGATNTIYLTYQSFDKMVLEFEAIKNFAVIDAKLFRPTFANTTELTSYSSNDWGAMLAQYSVTYDWVDSFIDTFGTNPVDILQRYTRRASTEFTSLPTNAEPCKVVVNTDNQLTEYIRSIAMSKTVLRSNQIQILEATPKEILEEIYTSDIPIHETEIIIAKQLVTKGSAIQLFSSPDQIIRLLVALYSPSEFTGQLNKQILKSITLKLPTRVRKQVLSAVNSFTQTDVRQMKKYLQFWKRTLKQCNYTSTGKQYKRYPNLPNIYSRLFNTTISTRNTIIEQFKRNGELDKAFTIEADNVGSLLRNLLFYLRYSEGTTFASKSNSQEHVVNRDVQALLSSEGFHTVLLKANPRLLWQTLALLNDPKWYTPMIDRKCNGVQFQYIRPLPPLDPTLTKLAKQAIKKAIECIKQEDNKSLGKVYIDSSCSNYPVQFTGRTDTSISISGSYLTSGSKLPLNLNEDSILRAGIAWRGDSCDIDLSLNISDEATVYYKNPVLQNADKILISSSGDVTSCKHDVFSAELADIDIQECISHGITDMFSSAIIYSGSTFADPDIEVYWFMQVISKEQRVIGGADIKIDLANADFAVKLEEPTKGMIGIHYNLVTKEAEVLNIPTKLNTGANALGSFEAFNKAINERPALIYLDKALKQSINKSQRVDNPMEADLYIGDNPPEGVKSLSPGTDRELINNLIF